MKSLKFNYIEEESNIIYTFYYFNGIAIPQDIEFKDLSDHSVNLSWKIDNINNINIDNNKIKYKIEMKKDNDQFIQIYEGDNLNYTVDNLEMDTNYEFRICSFYNNIKGIWTDIHKIKTLDIDSSILKDLEKRNEYWKKILEWCGYKKMELLYRGSKDGMLSKNFHDKCDNKGPTITLYKNEKCIFGGYSSLSWSSDGNWHQSPGNFLFTLINIYNIEPTKFPLKNSDQYDVYHHSNYGPTFGSGHDIGINNSDFLNNTSYANFPCSYQDILGKKHSIFSCDITNNNKKFKLKDIEVFKLIK